MKAKLILMVILASLALSATSANPDDSQDTASGEAYTVVVQKCSGNDCGCHIQFEFCIAGCSSNPDIPPAECRADCRQEQIQCAKECCRL